MTRGECLIASLPLKTSFYDAHEARAYRRLAEVAARVVDNPSLIEQGRDFLVRFVRDDPRQQRAFEAWDELLAKSAEQIARELLADSERGAALRDTAPVFVALAPPTATATRRLT
jgi:hypothetical protein